MFRLNKGTKKFEDYYEGPFFIIDVLGVTTFRLAKSPTSPRRVLNHDALLPYHTRDAEKFNLDNSWVFPISRTWRSRLLVDSSTQTDSAETPLPPDEPAASNVCEESEEGEDQAIHADPTPSTDSAPSAAGYRLRSRVVPRILSPSAPDMSLDKKPRKRGRPRKIRKEDQVENCVQTDIQIATRWTSE